MTEAKAKPAPQLSPEIRTELQAMSKTLSESLAFMRKLITDDNRYFNEYYKKHKDIKYRPLQSDNPDELGNPTTINMVMQADELGLAIKRLVDTISVIGNKLSGIEDPESDYTADDEEDHKENVAAKAKRALERAKEQKLNGK